MPKSWAKIIETNCVNDNFCRPILCPWPNGKLIFVSLHTDELKFDDKKLRKQEENLAYHLLGQLYTHWGPR